MGNFGELLDARTFPNKRICYMTNSSLVGEVRLANPMVGQAALQKHEECGEVCWLGQELIGSQLDGFNCAFD